jgi:HD superfamily phosphodiesterase
MTNNKPSTSGFHYFVHKGMNRSEKIQAKVMDMLLKSRIPQDKRESSVQWELRHFSGVIQFARMLAQKRDINEELAEVSAALHDMAVITNGSYTNHAEIGGNMARKLLQKSNNFSESEIEKIVAAVSSHSDKHVYSNDPLSELVKDSDTIDVFLYGDKIYDYKKEDVLIHYYKRVISIRKELNLPERQYFKQQLLLRGAY